MSFWGKNNFQTGNILSIISEKFIKCKEFATNNILVKKDFSVSYKYN